MRRWHTYKTRPTVEGGDFIIITKYGEVFSDCLSYDDNGRTYLVMNTKFGGEPDWENYKHEVHKWAYVNKFFEKELKETKNDIRN